MDPIKTTSSVVAFLTFLSATNLAWGNNFEQSLLKLALEGDGAMTLFEARASCEATPDTSLPSLDSNPAWDGGAFHERVQGEKQASQNRFVILPHKPNYLLPLSYNQNLKEGDYQHRFDNLDNAEIKFQLSLKAPVVQGVFDGYGDLYLAYTSVSWWQAYNSDISAAFRETNYEPEAFLVMPMKREFLGMNLRAVVAGLSHQSNGRSGELSRSWNRFYANFLFERENFFLSFKPWYRFKEDKKDPNDPNYPNSKGDDNPDIEAYMGYGELRFGYRYGDHQLSTMVRNNLRSENRGAAQVDWSFPLSDRFRGYVQYFNGYGESLIDYNVNSNRLSIGFMLTDWL